MKKLSFLKKLYRKTTESYSILDFTKLTPVKNRVDQCLYIHLCINLSTIIPFIKFNHLDLFLHVLNPFPPRQFIIFQIESINGDDKF